MDLHLLLPLAGASLKIFPAFPREDLLGSNCADFKRRETAGS
jgi:hypothetical protein